MSNEDQNQEQQTSNAEVSKEVDDNKTDTRSVPLSEFLDQKKANKDLKSKLAEFEAKEAEAAEKKALEEKDFQKVIESRNERIKELEKAFEESKRSNKLEKITNTLSRELDKKGVIDSDDALKLLDIDKFMEEGQDTNELLKQSVEELAQNKSYLFKAVTAKRSNSENGQPGKSSDGNTHQENSNQGRNLDKATAALVQMYSKT